MAAFPLVPLGHVASIDRIAAQPSSIDEGTLFVGLENIESGGRLTGVRGVSAGELASTKFRFTSQHILYGKLRPYLAKIARPDFMGVCSTDILPLAPGPKLDRAYLAQVLLTPGMVATAASLATGANLPRLSPTALARLEIPLPPLPEQRRIAAILDQADALRAKRREALAKLEELTQAIFLEMFGNPATNPKGWPVLPLSVCSTTIQIGPFGSLLHQSDYVVDGIPLVNPMHIQAGSIMPSREQSVSPDTHARLSLYHLKAGDVIMARRGEMGRVAVVSNKHEGLLCGTGSLFIRPDDSKVTSEYLAGFLSSPAVRRRLESVSLGITLSNLNRTNVAALLITLPPITLQRKFVRCLAELEQLRSSIGVSEVALETLFASLQHRAFRGEL